MPSHILNSSNKSSQSIFIHSEDSVINISGSDKIFYFDEAVVAPVGCRILIGLTNMVIPNAIYNVNSTSNTITISGVTYTITVGNYNAADLATAINTQISSIGSVAFNTDNNVFVFTFGSAKIIQSTTMERQLGLGNNQLPTASVTTYKATNLCDLGGVRNIYVRLTNLTMNNIDSNGTSNNIVASVVNDTNFGAYLFHTPSEVLYYQITEDQFNHLNIALTDQSNTPLELNGVEYTLTLTCHFVKQRESLERTTLLKQITEQYEKLTESEQEPETESQKETEKK